MYISHLSIHIYIDKYTYICSPTTNADVLFFIQPYQRRLIATSPWTCCHAIRKSLAILGVYAAQKSSFTKSFMKSFMKSHPPTSAPGLWEKKRERSQIPDVPSAYQASGLGLRGLVLGPMPSCGAIDGRRWLLIHRSFPPVEKDRIRCIDQHRHGNVHRFPVRKLVNGGLSTLLNYDFDPWQFEMVQTLCLNVVKAKGLMSLSQSFLTQHAGLLRRHGRYGPRKPHKLEVSGKHTEL